MDRGLRDCFARCTRAKTSGRGRNGRRRCSAASRRRSIARAASSRTRCCSTSTCSGSPASQWQQARAARRTASRLFGDLPFMVDGDSADVWARQHQFRLDVSVGVPPDAFSATGQDWGMPRLPLGRDRRGRLPLAARARAAQRRSLRRLPRRSSRRLLSHLRPPEGRRRGVLHAGRRAGAARARRDACSRCFAAPARRSSPRISAPCPTSCARRSRGSACPGFRVFRWERRLARRRDSRSAIRRTTRRCRSRRRARTTPNRSPSGGTPRRRPSGGR